MESLDNLAKFQCALFKSSRKHFISAIEMSFMGKNPIHHLTAASETAEAGEDIELTKLIINFLIHYVRWIHPYI